MSQLYYWPISLHLINLTAILTAGVYQITVLTAQFWPRKNLKIKYEPTTPPVPLLFSLMPSWIKFVIIYIWFCFLAGSGIYITDYEQDHSWIRLQYNVYDLHYISHCIRKRRLLPVDYPWQFHFPAFFSIWNSNPISAHIKRTYSSI